VKRFEAGSGGWKKCFQTLEIIGDFLPRVGRILARVSEGEPLPVGRYFAEAKLSIASLCGEKSGGFFQTLEILRLLFPSIGKFGTDYSKGWKEYLAPGRGAGTAKTRSGHFRRRVVAYSP